MCRKKSSISTQPATILRAIRAAKVRHSGAERGSFDPFPPPPPACFPHLCGGDPLTCYREHPTWESTSKTSHLQRPRSPFSVAGTPERLHGHTRSGLPGSPPAFKLPGENACPMSGKGQGLQGQAEVMSRTHTEGSKQGARKLKPQSRCFP